MIPTKKMTKAQAKQFADEIDRMSEIAFEDRKIQWANRFVTGFDSEYNQLRQSIVALFDESKKRGNYEVDLQVGLALYKEFNPDNGFSVVMANDDDIWRYLSCIVFPDITYERYPTPEKEIKEKGGHINHKRFYSATRRIWVKTLWWYVYLSWQGSEEKTYEVLKDFGTDTISDFIERTGQGYRLDLYRQVMLDYSKVENKSSDLFNRIQKQNLVNCRTTEPALVHDGEAGYVKTLFKQLEIGTDNGRGEQVTISYDYDLSGSGEKDSEEGGKKNSFVDRLSFWK